MESTVRRATVDDLQPLLALYQQLSPGDFTADREHAACVLQEILGSAYFELLVAEREGKVVGTCYINVIPNLTRGTAAYAVIENVVVTEELRNKGIGKLIIGAALGRAWERGCYKVMLQTGSKSEAKHNFYRSCGFSQTEKLAFVAHPDWWRNGGKLLHPAEMPRQAGSSSSSRTFDIGVHIRRLTPADAAVFHALRLFALRDAPAAFGSSFQEEKEIPASVIEGRLALQADQGTFGAFQGEEMIGVVSLGRENMKNLAHKAFIWGMYMKPEHRGKGIAKALLRAALSLAKSVPEILQVNLSVNASNAGAIRLYESLGFKSFGREPGAMRINGELHDELHMALRLVDA